MTPSRSPRQPGARSPAQCGNTLTPWPAAGSAAHARLVQEPRGRRHRHARGRLTEQLELEVLAERSPALDAADLGRPLPVEPAELGRPVRGVQVAAGAGVDGSVVERGAQELGLRDAARVRPHVDRRRGTAAAVEAEEPVPEGRDADRPDGGLVAREHAVETRGDGLEQPGGVVLDAAVPRDGGLVRDLAEPPRDGPARGVVEARAGGGGPDVERDDHCGKIAPMVENWEVLTLRGLASTDERAQEFTGTLVIHRVGSAEPVESIQVSIARSVLTELHENLGRLLVRSTGVARRKG